MCDQGCIRKCLVLDDFERTLVCVKDECGEDCKIRLPGRCLEIADGLPENHRVADIFDCDVGNRPWQFWRWRHGEEEDLLVNDHTGKCLEVYNGAMERGARVDQCACAAAEAAGDGRAAWSFKPTTGGKGGVRVVPAGRESDDLCLVVNGLVNGKMGDHNMTIFENSTAPNDTYWNTFAGKSNGAHLELDDCEAAAAEGDNREIWIIQGGSSHDSLFTLRSDLAGSPAFVGGVRSTCGNDFNGQVCDNPDDWNEWPSWLLANRIFASTERRAESSGSPRPPPEYDPYRELPWIKSSYVETQMMIHDRFFFNVTTGEYTVDRYLDDLKTRYGGIDGVLVWPPYPNLGLDNRNQFELARDMPGGIEGIAGFVRDFHARQVHVYFPLTPWDTGTAGEGAASFAQELAALLGQSDADGFNGDTMTGVPYDEFFTLTSAAIGRPAVLEPEQGMAGSAGGAWTAMSWGYGWQNLPSETSIEASKFRFLSKDHLTHICNRWATDHTLGIQNAVFNGIGFESWENIWGMFNTIVPFDAELLRRAATILRHFGNPAVGAGDTLLHADVFEPFTNVGTAGFSSGVFATRFANSSSGRSLWLLVSRNETSAVTGAQIEVAKCVEGTRFFDLYHGDEIEPEFRDSTSAWLTFPVESLGMGAVLSQPPSSPLPEADEELLATMRMLTEGKPLDGFSSVWPGPLPQTITPSPPAMTGLRPDGAVEISLASNETFTFKVLGQEIEDGCCPANWPGGYYNAMGVDVQYPWEPAPGRNHSRVFVAGDIAPFAMDTFLATNGDFKNFLDASGYAPSDEKNFLQNWDWSAGSPAVPAGWDNKPATWVALEDARAFCAWYGKRLPQEWEWQLAAQGPDFNHGDPARLYPWGDICPDPADGSGFIPRPVNGSDPYVPADVGTFQRGNSVPWGLSDMAGNVWQWTTEFSDAHTRAAILRGGSAYHPYSHDQFGNNWYFPGGAAYGSDGEPIPFGTAQGWGNNKWPQNYQLQAHAKMLLMAPSIDRAATVGFRCAADV